MENEQNVVTEAAQTNAENAVQAIQPAQIDATAQKGKKKGGKGGILGWLLILAAGIGVAVWLLFFNYQPTFSVDGQEFKMKNGVEAIYKAGLVLAYSDGSIVDEDTFSILPNTLYNVTYEVCKASNGKVTAKTGIRVKVFNSASNRKAIKNCEIYSITYTPEFADAGVTVLVNGQDFSKVSRSTAKDLCKAAKMQFKAKDLDGFASGSDSVVSASSSAFRWTIEESQGTIHLTFTKNNVKINYK